MRNKFLTKILGATLGLALAVGVGAGVTANNRVAREVDATYSGSSPWSYTMTTNDVSTSAAVKTLNNVSWSIDGATFKSWDDTKGIQLGSGSNPQSSDWTMTAAISQFGANVGITSISVGISTAKSGGIAWSLTAGGSNGTGSTGSSSSAITSVTTKTATYATPVTSGDVIIALNSNSISKAIYIHDISIGFVTTSNPRVTTSPESLYFRIGGSSQAVTASATNFSGAVSYSWAYQSGVDCVDLANENTATVTMTPKNNIVTKSTGVYRVTASYNTESATADVAVVVDKGTSSNPYTVAEARTAIDSEQGLTNAYAKVIVYKVDSYNQNYHSITYWISDDGTNTNPLEVYGGLSIEGGDPFSAKEDIELGSIVVVKGNLTKFNSTYEFAQDNHLVSQNKIASISVKTAPTKLTYNGEEDCFDPTGLVVTATYDDAYTKDYSYASYSSAFTFNPSKTTVLTDEDSVTITLFGGKSTTQTITVITREITGVTLTGDMSKKAYYENDNWDLSGLYLSVAWNIGTPNPSTVNLTTLTKGVDYTLDKDNASLEDTALYIEGTYEGFAFSKTVTGITVSAHPFEDSITYAKTAGIRGNGTSSWGTDNDVTDYTGATYRIHSMGVSSNTSAVRWNASGFLYAKTSPANAKLKSITLASVTSGKTINVYASNTPYDGVPSGDPLTTLNSTKLTYNFENVFKYIALKGTASSTEVGTITIAYENMSAKEIVEYNVSSTASLYYQYHKDDGGNFTYPSVAFRFGALLDKTLWAGIEDIQGYGVLVSTTDEIGSDPLKSFYEEAEAGVGGADYYYKPLTQKPEPSTATAAQKGDLVGDYYIWNVFYNIPSSAVTDEYVAVAFIKTSTEIIFMQEIRTSAAKIAYDLIQGGTDAGSAEGSLQNLANQYSA